MPAVVLQEESLRDHLRFGPKILRLEEQVSLVRRLASAGDQRIQVGSLVHPPVVPQMADTEALIQCRVIERYKKVLGRPLPGRMRRVIRSAGRCPG
ncbi:MAG: hypothetical protein EHM15_08030 [Desulfobacteraceae bacterium]|nr:MAG: hypothetical protein EHM15_08030 [Desulfobacteraceae bacterium]